MGWMRISTRTRLPGTVKRIKKSETHGHVVLDVGGHEVHATVTAEALEDLKLTQGKKVTAFVKSSDVILGVEDDDGEA